MEYKVEAIADSSGQWCGNALTFETAEQAETYARDLYSRWMAVREWRVMRRCRTCETWRVWQSEQSNPDVAGYIIDVTGFYCSRVCRQGADKLRERSGY